MSNNRLSERPTAVDLAVGLWLAVLGAGILSQSFAVAAGSIELYAAAPSAEARLALLVLAAALFTAPSIVHWSLSAWATLRLRQGRGRAKPQVVLSLLGVLSVGSDLYVWATIYRIEVLLLCGMHLVAVVAALAVTWLRSVTDWVWSGELQMVPDAGGNAGDGEPQDEAKGATERTEAPACSPEPPTVQTGPGYPAACDMPVPNAPAGLPNAVTPAPAPAPASPAGRSTAVVGLAVVAVGLLGIQMVLAIGGTGRIEVETRIDRGFAEQSGALLDAPPQCPWTVGWAWEVESTARSECEISSPDGGTTPIDVAVDAEGFRWQTRPA